MCRDTARSTVDPKKIRFDQLPRNPKNPRGIGGRLVLLIFEAGYFVTAPFLLNLTLLGDVCQAWFHIYRREVRAAFGKTVPGSNSVGKALQSELALCSTGNGDEFDSCSNFDNGGDLKLD